MPFFSSFGTLEDGDERIICPVDVSEAGEILDRLFVQLFDRVARFCGNNTVCRTSTYLPSQTPKF